MSFSTKKMKTMQAIEFLEEDGEKAWSNLAAEQFFAGYAESDTIYDKLGEDENVDKIKPQNG